jgi:Family of unknown function (DUF6338)
MVPTTAGAFIAFLLFVAPGLLWEILWERHRLPVPGSTFREISRVGLISVLCSGTAIVLLAVVRTLHSSWMLDVGAWLRRGDNYLDQHYALIGVTVAVEVGLACLIAGAAYLGWARRLKPDGRNVKEPVLWSLVAGRASAPSSRRGARLHVGVRTTGGSVYVGAFLAVDVDPERENAMLALQPPIEFKRLGETAASMPLHWERLSVPLANIAEL